MPKLNTFTRLRIIHLLLGMMFFYGIEQVFLNQVIGSSSARGYVTIVYVSSVLVFDIPAGVIADKFSRKWCVVAACVIQALSVFVLGASTNLGLYLLGSLLFGLAIGLCDGAIQALLYDKLADESQQNRYGREQGRNYAAFLIGAALANIASGFLAHNLGVRSAYYYSIVPCLLAFLLALSIAESTRHKQQQSLSWFKHLGSVAREISHHRRILVFATQFVTAEILINTVGEFGQIYILSFGVSTIMLGLLWAVGAGFAAGGRLIADRFQSYPRLFVTVYCLLLGVFAITHHIFGIGLFWLFYGLNETLQNIAETEIQHETESHVRATTLSVIGFVGNAAAIPIIFFYTHYYVAHGIMSANRVVIVPGIIVLLLTLLVKITPSHNPLFASRRGMPIEKA